MKIKVRYLKLHYGVRGFFLSLDALIAVVVLLTVISPLFANIHDRENLQNLYTSKRGSDIAALIDNSKKIDTLDRTEIMNEVAGLLSSENIEINITTYRTDLTGKSNIDFNIGGKPKNFVSSGKRFFVVSNTTGVTNFGVIRYKLWQK